MKDLPFRFGQLYIICGFIGTPYLVYLATQESSPIEAYLNVGFAILFLIQSIGLYQRKYWGLIAFYVEVVYATFVQGIVYAIVYSIAWGLSTTIYGLMINSLILIYFYKRRFMFN